MKRTTIIITVLAILATLLMVSCGNGAIYNSEKPSDGISNDYEPDSQKNASSLTADALEGRKLIKDARISLDTENYDSFMNSVNASVNENGGYIESTNSTGNSDSSNRYTSLVIRIPSDKYDVFVASLPGMATVSSKSESVRDVTSDYIDIESRLNALKAERESLKALLEKAETLNDVILIHDRLSDVTGEIEGIESTLKQYDSRISLSTITLSVREVEKEISGHGNVGERLISGLVTSFKNIGSGSVELLIWLVGALPYIAVIAAVTVAIVFICKSSRKRRRKKKAEMLKGQSSGTTTESQQ